MWNKVCNKCLKSKPLSEYYSKRPGLLQAVCKDCTKAKVKTYRDRRNAEDKQRLLKTSPERLDLRKERKNDYERR